MNASTIAIVVAILGSGGLGSIITSLLLWKRLPHEADKLDAQRDEIMQDLGRKNTEAAAHVVDLVKDEIEELKAERSALRDRALHAEAAEAKAKAEHAQAVAELAAEKAARSQERHEAASDRTARDARIATLERQVAQLESQLSSLLASHGLGGRRSDDPSI